jgi:transposase-like protein
LVWAAPNAVHDDVSSRRTRTLETIYAIVSFEALRVKSRDQGTVRKKAVYFAIGMRSSCHKEILGLWIEQTESAKFWLPAMSELKVRNCQAATTNKGLF